ncbi:MAG: EamA family transporter, partial [Rhodospirillaceae bacterium]|nr:EamA family transporter [Rhodospirillaceae bacterium]
MKDWGGIAAGLGTVLCVVVMLIAGRLGATTDALTIYDMAALRMGVAVILAIPLLVRYFPWRVRLRDHAIVAFFGGAPFILMLFGGMTYAPVGHASVVMYGALPIFAALVAWAWVGDRPGRWQWAGIFAIVAGVAGAELSSAIVVVLGVANLVGDGFSMAASSFLSARTEGQRLERARRAEELHIERVPDGEREEVRQIYAAKGFAGEDLETVVSVITSDRELWVETMLREELGLSSDPPEPVRTGLATFTAFLFAGFVPLLFFVAD